MKFETEKELIKEIIIREGIKEIDLNFKYMNELAKERKEDIEKKIKEIGANYREIEELLTEKDGIEAMYYFERGVIAGLGWLNYLKKYFDMHFESLKINI